MKVFLIVAALLLALALIIFAGYKLLSRKKDSKKGMEAATDSGEENLHTRDLCFEVLKRLNCNLVDNDKSDDIVFKYQNEFFTINAVDDSMFIHIWDYGWEEVDMSDIDELSRYRRAVNEMNWHLLTVLCYTCDKEETDGKKLMHIHSCISIPLVPEIPNIDSFFAYILGHFFFAHRKFELELDRLRNRNE